MREQWPSKMPGDNADFDINYTLRLNGDTIASSTWSFVGTPTDISMGTQNFNNGFTKLWLSGGTIGSTYTFLNVIVTAGGRTLDQVVFITVVDGLDDAEAS